MCEKRAKMKLLMVFTMLVLAVFEQAQGAGADDGTERPRVLCGRILADARMLYCFSSDAQKRYSESPLIVSLYPRHLSMMWPWLARRIQQQQQQHQHALALRGKRDPGLVDECCLKPCYMSELLNYC